jgi:hypothetical protein
LHCISQLHLAKGSLSLFDFLWLPVEDRIFKILIGEKADLLISDQKRVFVTSQVQS